MSVLPFTTPEGKYRAQCRICGKVVCEFPVLDIPIIGQPDDKAKRVLTILGTHIASKHGEQFQAGLALVGDFQAFLLLSQFETGDPSIQARAETIRAGLQALTRKFTLSDAHIERMVVDLDSANQLTAANVITAIRQIRDVLMEQGRYAPTIDKPQSSLVV